MFIGKPEGLNIDKETRKELIKFYEIVLSEELVERAMIRSHFQDKQELSSNIIKPFRPDQLKSTDNIECFYCINLCYLSYVKCNRCKKVYCKLRHSVKPVCRNADEVANAVKSRYRPRTAVRVSPKQDQDPLQVHRRRTQPVLGRRQKVSSI